MTEPGLDKRTSLYSVLHGYEGVEEGSIEKIQNELRRQGELLLRKTARAPAPRKHVLVISIYQLKTDVQIFIDEIRISATNLSRTSLQSPTSNAVSAAAYLEDRKNHIETIELFGKETAEEIKEFLEKIK